MHVPPPLDQHRWLARLVGEWTFVMPSPDDGREHTGTLSVKQIGDFWVVGDGHADDSEGGEPMKSVLTLGFDPAKNAFVGTFIASVMTKLWIYEGTLDADGKTLPLATRGPSMTGDGAEADYVDTYIQDADDRWTLRSSMKGDDDQWHEFMNVTYTRA